VSVCYVDGEFVPSAEARVSVFDHSFLYGDGCFETILCRHGCPFELSAHLDRLWASCAYLRIRPPETRAVIAARIGELLELAGLADGWVRVVVSRGEGYPASDPRHAERPYLVISVQGEPSTRRDPTLGITLTIASTRRIPPVCLDPRVKANNYLNHIVAKWEAIAAGADEALLLDVDGNVAELGSANVFAVRGTTLATPPPQNILAGITRATVLRLAGEGVLGAEVVAVERHLAPYDLYTADEVFVVGTGAGVMGVREIDGRTVGAGRIGPVTERVRTAYETLVEAATIGRAGAS
jgi:branched-chain amino acid aminotransferase